MRSAWSALEMAGDTLSLTRSFTAVGSFTVG